VMVYLGGVGSLGGSIMGATVYTLVLEGLRTVLQTLGISQEWRLVVAPLMLILLMIFRPKGIMGLREFRFLIPSSERHRKNGPPGGSPAPKEVTP
jgi:branched-chain amino acid transport system permease protein